MIGLAITPGDPHGIGPEVLHKTLCKKAYDHKTTRLVAIGALAPFKKLRPKIKIHTLELAQLTAAGLNAVFSAAKPSDLIILPAPANAPTKARQLEGYQSGWSIEQAVRLVEEGLLAALVTGPISKDRLNRGGYPFPGHTELLAHLTGTPAVTMMLANDQLRVSLVTSHIPIAAVSTQLTPKLIQQTILQTEAALLNWWAIKSPHIAVCALNPHAGESGRLGKEEIHTISPAVKSLIRSKKLNPKTRLTGPLPADTLFTKKSFDAVICMYHDQGLIPVKQIDFAKTVNVTLGLPIIRTSVDHGVAFDIVGRNVADPTSLQSAIKLALHLVRTKKGRLHG